MIFPLSRKVKRQRWKAENEQSQFMEGQKAIKMHVLFQIDYIFMDSVISFQNEYTIRKQK